MLQRPIEKPIIACLKIFEEANGGWEKTHLWCKAKDEGINIRCPEEWNSTNQMIEMYWKINALWPHLYEVSSVEMRSEYHVSFLSVHIQGTQLLIVAGSIINLSYIRKGE